MVDLYINRINNHMKRSIYLGGNNHDIKIVFQLSTPNI